MRSERFSLPVDHPGIDEVSALFEEPDAAIPTRRSAFLLAHGAGFHMESPWMETVARGLVARGYPVLRFNYPYWERALREKKRRPPDPAPRLEEAHARAAAALRARAGDRRLILSGKSLGARMGSHLAAKGVLCHGLVFFGYPLHPPGKPDRLRSEHFAALVQPTLFLQGTRDPLCDLELLRRELRRFGGSVGLEVIEGADHSFRVPRSSGRSDDQVLEDLLDRTAAWEAAAFPD